MCLHVKECIKCRSTKTLSEYYVFYGRIRNVCKECVKSHRRNYYWSNPEVSREKGRKYYAEHREERIEYSRQYVANNPNYPAEWYARNAERQRERSRNYNARTSERKKKRDLEWRAKNPEVVRSKEHRRRARVHGAAGSHTAKEWQAIVKKQRGRCAICGIASKLDRDHIVPISKGGSNFAFNIQGLCPTCNREKRDKIVQDAHPSLFDSTQQKKP